MYEYSELPYHYANGVAIALAKQNAKEKWYHSLKVISVNKNFTQSIMFQKLISNFTSVNVKKRSAMEEIGSRFS